MVSETEWTAEICDKLTKGGSQVYPLIGSYRAPRGWPDRLIIHKDFTVLIEFKGIDTKLETHQKQRMKKINELQPNTAFIARLTEHDGKRWKGIISNHYEIALGEFTSVREFVEFFRKHRKTEA